MKAQRLLVCLCTAVLSIGAASPALGLANRVFVSARSGNNANACDNIATPCQTLQGAIGQLNPGGEAIVLDSGGYGPVTITQSVAIDAAPGITAFIHPPSGDAITINAGAAGAVTLRGLTLNGGSGNGIKVNSAGSVNIENCLISGLTSNMSNGILVASNSNIFIKDTIVGQNVGDGITFAAGRASIDHCRVEGNTGAGVRVAGADVTVRDSVTAGNGAQGFFVTDGSSNAILNVYQCMSTNNGGDGIETSKFGSGFVIARVANSSISENFGVGLVAGAGVTFESLGNNFVRGNIGGSKTGTVTVVLPE